MIKRAALMARVSSDEQAKGYSLDVQLDSLTKYCERNNILIVKVFKEDHSAKSFNRPAFIEFMQFLKKNKGVIDVLLFSSWDRFSRNTSEAYMMINELRKLGVEAQAVEQPIDLSIPENKAMLAFYLAIPEIENDRRSIKINGGIRGARKEGRITGCAPRGYSNKRDERNKPIIVPNEHAEFIANAFKAIANGIPMPEVINKLLDDGVKVSKSQVYLLFRNPMYCGYIKVPAGDKEEEYFTKGIHEPIVSEAIFSQAQEILTGRRLSTNKHSVVTKKEELPLRGVLLCNNCKKHITGSASRSHTGKRHFYYHCNHCKQQRFKADLANETIEKILSDFKFSNDIKNLYQAMVKENLGICATKDNLKVKNLKDQIILQNTRIQNLQDLLVDGKLSHAEYANLGKKYESLKSKLIIELSSLEKRDETLLKNLEKSINQMANIGNIYKMSDVATKSKLLGSIFPEKFSFDGIKCRTPRINEVLRQTLNIDKGFKGAKKRQLSKNLELSCLVEATGFEPVTLCL